MLNTVSRAAFSSANSIVHRKFDSVSKAAQALEIARFDPMLPLKTHSAIETSDIAHQYNITAFKNGLKVLTESTNFPGTVNLGILLDVGTRDETEETSGSLLALRNS